MALTVPLARVPARAEVSVHAEVGCPSADQVSAALAQGRSAQAAPLRLVLEARGAELVLRLLPVASAGEQAGARAGSSGVLLERSLPSSDGVRVTCAALADTVALIVERYLDELAAPAASNSPSDSRVTSIEREVLHEELSITGSDSGRSQRNDLTPHGPGQAAREDRAALGILALARPGRVSLAALALGVGVRGQGDPWFVELLGTWTVPEQARWSPGPGSRLAGDAVLDAAAVALWVGRRWHSEGPWSLALDSFVWAQLEHLVLRAARSPPGEAPLRYAGWEPGVGAGLALQGTPLARTRRVFARITLCGGTLLERHEFRLPGAPSAGGATPGVRLADSPRLHVSLGLGVGVGL